uniref:Androgen-induced gene 1 protein n=1 Tax=Aceria tosichella TaxID=561515 RepID=A0A6G1SLJ7_9ACAR
MTSSGAGLLVSLAAAGAYSYSFYYLNGMHVQKGFVDMIPKQLQVYGIFKFLTIQCLIIQLVSAILHVLAHFIRPLRGLRDLVFTALAFPVGSIVVYTFWLVWHTMGRESIFPAKLDAFYPVWLNHATHSIIAPINILLALTINHRYYKNAVLVTLIYMLSYTIFLHVIKAQTGLFVYGYLNEINDTQRLVYFAATGLFVYLMYKFGQLLRYIAHGSGGSSRSQQTSTPTKKSKGQKQR